MLTTSIASTLNTHLIKLQTFSDPNRATFVSELKQNVTFQEEESHQTPDFRLVDGHDSENEEHRVPVDL